MQHATLSSLHLPVAAVSPPRVSAHRATPRGITQKVIRGLLLGYGLLASLCFVGSLITEIAGAQ